MNQLSGFKRVQRLIDEAIDAMHLDLTGLTVLTEAASGAFVTTALIAARAHADCVLAVTRDSKYGSVEEVIEYGGDWAARMGVANRIQFTDAVPASLAPQADIVTNLGFLRPIDRPFVEALRRHAVIALMWEPWEFRDSDLDRSACERAGILVIGTREADTRLNTADYVGVVAAKLLLEANIEVLGSGIVIVGSEPFGSATAQLLRAMGAHVTVVALPDDRTANLDELCGDQVEVADALVVLEHRDHREVVGNQTGIRPTRLAAHDTRLIHLCGGVDHDALESCGIPKWPAHSVPLRSMTVTTDYAGPKPVIDLHCAGLKVAEAAVRIRLAGGSLQEAIQASVATGLGLPLEARADDGRRKP